MPSFQTPVVVAIAGPLLDPKVIAEQFKVEFMKTFGKDRPKITGIDLNTDGYFSMKLQGKSLKYLVETYVERHPTEFPANRDSRAYHKAIQKHRERIRKNLQRLNATLDQWLGDKK